jgi:hypothetical protein
MLLAAAAPHLASPCVIHSQHQARSRLEEGPCCTVVVHAACYCCSSAALGKRQTAYVLQLPSPA